MRMDISDLSYGYGSGAKILHDISAEFESSNLVCIIGPNGVGKSTFVKCLNRLLVPETGKVLLDGVDISTLSRRDMAMKIGYVPPTSRDMFSVPVLDAIMIGRHNLQGWRNTQEDLDRTYAILKLLDIEDLAMRDFNSLSSGQHQKVAIARGLAMETPVLILDEPTSNLDVRHQVYITEMLRGIAKETDKLVIMISHDLNIASKYADKVVVMAGGTVHSSGLPKDVVTRDMVRDVYGVDCQVMDVGGRPVVVLGSPL
ncbi:MAG: ABC transporter ATP-binding protein [Candidatus Methanomethylophilaceae archaeon]|nr:ABC transporter ATP-binding protein [Candidatus Methanomethylophilaceae archaeon]MBR4697029.1 ABC transporter ATP-binding protein [Candidatus Methanomethylophilaceae archaeon]MBR6871092.1 ABC transporter ATP-binding protein [Candidatus Methanomethylophilaceae archaeon]